eukprot:262488-Prymnesium_polylepis.2
MNHADGGSSNVGSHKRHVLWVGGDRPPLGRAAEERADGGRVAVDHERSGVVAWREERRYRVVRLERPVVQERAQVADDHVLLQVAPKVAARESLQEQLAEHGLQVRDLGGASGSRELRRHRDAEERLCPLQHLLQRDALEPHVSGPIERCRPSIAHQQESDAWVHLERAQQQRRPRRPAAPAREEQTDRVARRGRRGELRRAAAVLPAHGAVILVGAAAEATPCPCTGAPRSVVHRAIGLLADSNGRESHDWLHPPQNSRRSAAGGSAIYTSIINKDFHTQVTLHPRARTVLQVCPIYSACPLELRLLLLLLTLPPPPHSPPVTLLLAFRFPSLFLRFY